MIRVARIVLGVAMMTAAANARQTPDEWRESGGTGTIELLNGVLIVRSGRRVQRQVEQFLAALRSADAASTAWSTRVDMASPQTRPAGVTPGVPLLATPDVNWESEQAVYDKLNSVKVSLAIDKTGLQSALSQLGRQSGVEIVADWQDLANNGIPTDATVSFTARDVTASAALVSLLQLAGGDVLLGWEAHDQFVLVATRECLWRATVVRIYWIGDLVPATSRTAADGVQPSDEEGEGYEEERERAELLETIRRNISPDCWRENGGHGVLRTVGDVLIARAPRTEQRGIERFLDALRTARSGSVRKPSAAGR